jgi:hypothetical protein
MHLTTADCLSLLYLLPADAGLHPWHYTGTRMIAAPYSASTAWAPPGLWLQSNTRVMNKDQVCYQQGDALSWVTQRVVRYVDEVFVRYVDEVWDTRVDSGLELLCKNRVKTHCRGKEHTRVS